jgi:hypothetical protein
MYSEMNEQNIALYKPTDCILKLCYYLYLLYFSGIKYTIVYYYIIILLLYYSISYNLAIITIHLFDLMHSDHMRYSYVYTR